jgi:hypothetical protein
VPSPLANRVQDHQALGRNPVTASVQQTRKIPSLVRHATVPYCN